MSEEGVCVDCGEPCDDRVTRCEECRIALLEEERDRFRVDR